MKVRKSIMVALSLVMLLYSGQKSLLGADDDPYLESLIEEVLERNPDLQRAREKKSASGHLVLPSGTLPDPQVGLSFSNFPVDSFSRNREPMTSIDVFLQQKIPFPGKLSLKEEIAAIRSEQAGKTVAELENALTYRTKRAYFRLYEIFRAIEITEKTRAILTEFLEIARQRYAVGRALQQDVLRAQTSVSNIEKRLYDLNNMRVEVVALINTLRSEAVDRPVSSPTELPLPEIDLEEGMLVESAKESNPTLARLQLKIGEGEKGVSLARRERYPDFALITRYRVREDRSDFFTGAITLNLPLFASRKQNEVVSSRKFELRSSESAYESSLNQISFRIRDITSDLFSLRNRISLLDSAILPEAKHTVESALSSYRVGKLEFNSLVGAELDLFKYELEMVSLMGRYNERIAELWMVVGKNMRNIEVGNE